MQIFTVGGAVRDKLLGLPVQDRDYVVVGASPDEMRQRGFKPVGKDFPVFLHPQTHEEYALARTERKTGHGYHGFSFHAAPEVSLEEDLARRDLTINAIAQSDDGALIDPFHGVADLEARILRHVGPAFAEDPVRLLRVARFAARFTDFSIAPETTELMRRMVDNGEADHLVAERVWQELAKGLMEAKPSRMIDVLRSCGALARLLPELDRLFGVPQRAEFHPEIDTGVHVMMALDYAAGQGYDLPVRFAVLLHDLGKGLTPASELPRHVGHEARSVTMVEKVCAYLKTPADCRDLALLVARYHGDIRRGPEMRAATLARILEDADALRRPQRFVKLLEACASDFHGRLGWEDKPIPAPELFLIALGAIRAIDAAPIAHSCSDATQIAGRLHEARVAAIKRALNLAE
ncbi:multifunctional CCA addition/repair protein [Propionivibrio sp.]|uniref:multifunctional CCA addition/repair protein n=1 Tax=Propionivibrio sp. TaxID=2212460 RepID=UPI0025F12059|nr:multifunctional CCA addition/repair protein [Propionivibrio sp.]MBK7354834.1 multifunctional CCA addition/repair protein [Propionivibrio sp.]MBK8745893.1 multifunctional CCA addition/repair protein [Propionivibrio sp.]MBK8892659.1 multifunctional CCA addition/repair protein [Propionivibrio sp.]MBL0207450.1 multifunctional CCA addition/repair protein [Propionivibrio sp.]